MIRRRFLARAFSWLALAVIPLAAVPAIAAEVSEARLGAEDARDVKRVEDYLNALRTLEAKFVQISSSGEFAEGTFYLNRPGKLRIEYAPPMQVLIVADGTFLTYVDKELNQATHLDLHDTPAGLLLERELALSSAKTAVTGFERGPGTLRVTVQRRADPQSGRITFVFADKPLVLRKWSVIDAQGVKTDVSLMEVRQGGKLDPKLFEYIPPAGIDQRG